METLDIKDTKEICVTIIYAHRLFTDVLFYFYLFLIYYHRDKPQTDVL